MRYRLEERQVDLRGDGHFIAPGAAVIGSVVLGEAASVWFNAVIRGDHEPIVVGPRSNVQDGAVLHTDPGFPLEMGQGVTVGHGAVLHGCKVEDYSLIGIKAVVLNGAKIGKYCLIGAGSLVPEGKEIPEGSLVVGVPGKVVRQLTDEERRSLEESAANYAANGRRFAQHLAAD